MAKQKRNVSKRTRFEVFKRDLFTCQYCGNHPPAVILEVDHILPVAATASNREDNLATSCQDCNRGKSNQPLHQIVPSLANQMVERAERAEQLQAYNTLLLELRERELHIINELGWYWHNMFLRPKNKYVFGSARRGSIATFLTQLAPCEIYSAIDLTFSRKPANGEDDQHTWLYFCGICWRKIKGDRER